VVYKGIGYFSITVYIYQAAGGWSLVPPVVKSKIIAGNKKFSHK